MTKNIESPAGNINTEEGNQKLTTGVLIRKRESVGAENTTHRFPQGEDQIIKHTNHTKLRAKQINTAIINNKWKNKTASNHMHRPPNHKMFFFLSLVW